MMVDAIQEDFDPFWVFKKFESNNLASTDLTENASISPTENIDLSEMIRGAGISFGVSFVVWGAFDYLYKEAAKRVVKNFLEYITQADEVNLQTIAEVTFDIILFSYPSAMLIAVGKSKGGNTSSVIKGTFSALFNKQRIKGGGFANWMSHIGNEVNKPYRNVSDYISRNILAFLTNCYIPFGLIQSDILKKFMKEYIKKRHTEYENIAPVASHPLGGKNVIELLNQDSHESIIDYFKHRYKGHFFLSDQRKKLMRFRKYSDDMPIGNNSIYE